MTLPWAVAGFVLSDHIRTYAIQIMSLNVLVIHRPDVEMLHPQQALQHLPHAQVAPGHEWIYLRDVVRNHPLRLVYLPNTLELLAQDATAIAMLNQELGNRLIVVQSRATNRLRGWLDSGRGWNWP